MSNQWHTIAFNFSGSLETKTRYPHLAHWGQVTQICFSNLTITGSDNGLSPDRDQATVWTKAWILLIGLLWTNFSEILIEINILSFKKTHVKMSSAKWLSFCLGLNVVKRNVKKLLGNVAIYNIRPKNISLARRKPRISPDISNSNITKSRSCPIFV